MTVWSSYRDDYLRFILRDPVSASPTYSDPTLMTLANQALAALSVEVGLNQMTTLTGSGPTYTLPDDFIKVIAIVDEDQLILDRYIPNPRDKLRSGQTPASYMLHWPTKGQVTLPITSTKTYTLYYVAQYTALAAESDTLPFYESWLEQALAFYVGYLAMANESVGRSMLEQWATAPELRVNTPLLEQANWFYEQYLSLLARHK